jgi:tetratricopeptide (TPR) repeat protein
VRFSTKSQGNLIRNRQKADKFYCSIVKDDWAVMKKGFLLIVFVLFFTAGVSPGRQMPLANEGKRGLYARTIEQVLRLDAEEVDLAIAALIISEQWSDIVHGRRYQSELDNMALEIRARLEDKGLNTSYKAVAVINKYLFDELGFKSVSEARDPNDLFLHSVLDRKRGHCLSLSVLYLSLGERLGLPLYGVVVPEHFFVRYDDGRVRFNIETTSKGGYAPDEHYVNKFKVPKKRRGSIYMANLNKIQTLGCFFNNLGSSYDAIGDTDHALTALERAVEINPLLSESRTNLGNVYLKMGQVKDAIYEYRRALKINPRDAKTQNNLGNAYTKRGWLNDAISQYIRSINLDPNFTDAYKNLAVAYCKQKKFGRAIVQLKEAIILEPKDALLYSQLGDVYSQMDNFNKAILQYKKALKIKRDFAEAHCGLGICYNKLGWVDDEIQAYKKALAVKPNMLAALVNLGNAYFSKEKYDAAIEQYKKAVRIKPEDGTLHHNLGAAYSNKKKYKEAVAAYLRAVELEPKMGDAHNGLAFGFYQLKNYDLAFKHIQSAEQSGAEIDKKLLGAIKKKLR